MLEGFNPVRYSIIKGKCPREIVMLVGNGCKWRKCRFCDYHLDSSPDVEFNFKINKAELEKAKFETTRLRRVTPSAQSMRAQVETNLSNMKNLKTYQKIALMANEQSKRQINK